MSAQAEQMKAMVGELVALAGGSKNGARPDPPLSIQTSHTGSHPEPAAPHKKDKKLWTRNAKESSPEQIIPLEDNFEDF